MRDVLLDFLSVSSIDRVNFTQIAVEDGAAGEFEIVRLTVAAGWEVSVAEIVLESTPNRRPVFIEAGNRHQVRQVHLFDESNRSVDEAAHMIQTLGVDGVNLFFVNRTRHAPHQIVGMRILSAEDGVNPDNFFLPFQCFEVVCHRQQVDLRRELVCRMPPVAVGEDAQLAALHEGAQAGLQIREVFGRSLWPV